VSKTRGAPKGDKSKGERLQMKLKTLTPSDQRRINAMAFRLARETANVPKENPQPAQHASLNALALVPRES